MSYNDTLKKEQIWIYIDQMPEGDENDNLDRSIKSFEEITEFDKFK